MPKSSYAEDTMNWHQLASELARREAELPGLEENRASLEEVVKHCRALTTSKRTQEARLRVTIQELRKELSLGRELESRLRASLRGHFGAHNPELIGFGGKPLRQPRRSRVPAVGTPKPAEAAAEGPGVPEAPGKPEGDGRPN